MLELNRQGFIFLCFFLNSLETTNHNETITDEGLTTSIDTTVKSTSLSASSTRELIIEI